jgi:hypothetical protein
VTVAVILGMIALGVLLIHLLNSQHSERIAAYHYGRSGTPVPGPAPQKARSRAGASVTGGRRDHRDGGRGRLRPRRRARKGTG